MRSFIAVAIVLVLLVGVAHAAEVPTAKGDKAMVFMFKGFDHLGLRGYPGCYGLGMRYYINDGVALRGGVMFGKDSETEKSDMEGYADTEWNDSTIGVDLVYERHLEAPCPSISPYWGVGAGFLSETNEYIYAAGMDMTNTETDKFSGFRAYGVLGFEWGFTGCMTLGGEYQLGLMSGSGETEYDTEGGTRSETRDEWEASSMGFSTASVYLSVYW